MKLLILGATGQVGGKLVRQSLDRGFHVTALARSPGKMEIEHPKLDVLAGNPLEQGDLGRALAGKDVVLSILGHTDLKPSDIVAVGARSLVAAMSSVGVNRLVIVSSTLVPPGGSFLTKLPRYLTRHALNDSAEMEGVVNVAPVDWTILRLVRLTNKPLSSYRIFENEPATVTASISRSTVARCMIDLIGDERYYRKTIGICATRSVDHPTRRAHAIRSD